MQTYVDVDVIGKADASLAALKYHRLLMRFAFSLCNVYVWIFIFQYFVGHTAHIASALTQTALLFALAQDIALLLTPLSGMRIRNGVRNSMMQGVAVAAIALLLLGATLEGFLFDVAFLGILGYAILFGMYRALYWIPYKIGAANTEVGSMIHGRYELLLAFAPAIAGLLLAFGYPAQVWLLLVSASLLSASLLPLTRVPDTHEGYSWSYSKTFHELFSRKHRRFVGTALVDGIAGGALLLFWPIAAFLIVGSSYLVLGIVLSITFLIVILTRSMVKKFLRSTKIERSSLVLAAVAASSWLLRLVVASPLGIIVVDTYYYGGNPVRGTGVDPFTHEQFADHGSYIDELTALKEIALAIGKICICLIGATLTALVSLPLVFLGVFVGAAIASAISVYVARTTAPVI